VIDTSIAAGDSIDRPYLERLVLAVIDDFGEHGCISDEVRARLPQLSYSSVTARFRALLDEGLIVDTGNRARGKSGRYQRVMVSARHLKKADSGMLLAGWWHARESA
jgi:hypothetical protein